MASQARTSPLLVRGADVPEGDLVSIAPSGQAWRYIRFRATRLRTDGIIRGETADNEMVLVVISGSVHVASPEGSWKNVGQRADPFSGPPSAVYLPSSTSYEIVAASHAEIAICKAPGPKPYPARRIELDTDAGYVRGEGHAQRRIYNILMDEDGANSLFLTEVITFPGNWSSYPPHKHDTDNPPVESQLEELYYYRAQPQQGFAFQRIYTESGDLDEMITAHNTDVVLVPRGYHVCAAAAQYSIYYLNVLAGPKHVYHMTFDPAHAWIKEGWTW